MKRLKNNDKYERLYFLSIYNTIISPYSKTFLNTQDIKYSDNAVVKWRAKDNQYLDNNDYIKLANSQIKKGLYLPLICIRSVKKGYEILEGTHRLYALKKTKNHIDYFTLVVNDCDEFIVCGNNYVMDELTKRNISDYKIVKKYEFEDDNIYIFKTTDGNIYRFIFNKINIQINTEMLKFKPHALYNNKKYLEKINNCDDKLSFLLQDFDSYIEKYKY